MTSFFYPLFHALFIIQLLTVRFVGFFLNIFWPYNPIFWVLNMATSADVPVSQAYYHHELPFAVLPTINYICNFTTPLASLFESLQCLWIMSLNIQSPSHDPVAYKVCHISTVCSELAFDLFLVLSIASIHCFSFAIFFSKVLLQNSCYFPACQIEGCGSHSEGQDKSS